MDFSLDTAIDDAGSQPCGYYLKSNCPNPFNAATTFTFGLAQEGRVRIRLYDIRGARAADVLDAYRPAGEHTIQYDARDLASGLYFCRMTAGEYEAKIKVLAVK